MYNKTSGFIAPFFVTTLIVLLGLTSGCQTPEARDFHRIKVGDSWSKRIHKSSDLQANMIWEEASQAMLRDESTYGKHAAYYVIVDTNDKVAAKALMFFAPKSGAYLSIRADAAKELFEVQTDASLRDNDNGREVFFDHIMKMNFASGVRNYDWIMLTLHLFEWPFGPEAGMTPTKVRINGKPIVWEVLLKKLKAGEIEGTIDIEYN
ncbi:MAG: hypothetical protein K8S55_12690 [Phycisphaerae bacterium]|nr:hypothetical protein [Phycisphaerae bacterium]